MPIGSLFRWVGGVIGDNAVGNAFVDIGNAVDASGGAGGLPALPPSVDPTVGHTPAVTPTPPAVTPTPTPPAVGGGGGGIDPRLIPVVQRTGTGPDGTVPEPPDTFDNTGTIVGGLLGGIDGAILGRQIGSQIPVPGSSSMSSGMNSLEIASALKGGNRKAMAEYLLFSGGLKGIVRPATEYRAKNGKVKYGSDIGNVVIRRTRGGQTVVFQAPKEIARLLGFWKPRKKPLISVRDSTAIRRSTIAKRRLLKAAKSSGLHCTTTRPCRTTRKSTTTTRRRR